MYKNDILRKDYIDNGTHLQLYCNANTPAIRLHCNNGKLDDMPSNVICKGRLSAQAIGRSTTCAADGLAGKLYDVAYRFPTGSIITLYTVCYSTAADTVLYSIHEAHRSYSSASSFKRGNWKDLLGRSNRHDSFRAANIYKTFTRLLGPQQTYMRSNRDFALHRGHMANIQDFITYDQREATMVDMNSVPMSRSCNSGNWKRIENWIHTTIWSNTAAKIVTGTHDVLHLAHSQSPRFVKIYLMANGMNRMPRWVYKVFRYNNACHVFIALNDPSVRPARTVTPICTPTSCPNDLIFSRNKTACIAYCCDYRKFVQQVGTHAMLC